MVDMVDMDMVDMDMDMVDLYMVDMDMVDMDTFWSILVYFDLIFQLGSSDHHMVIFFYMYFATQPRPALTAVVNVFNT